jgi:DNA-binding transcriptional MerR regulator
MANLSELASGERLLRPGQVQQLLGIAASTLWSYVHRGLITPAQRTAGGHARYRESEVAAFKAQLLVAAEAPAELEAVA